LTLARADDVGTIEPGRLADLVVLRADPLLDIRNARRIELVIKEGHVFESLALLR
jgi:imidazolonepropionase-like amidohydrolase